MARRAASTGNLNCITATASGWQLCFAAGPWREVCAFVPGDGTGGSESWVGDAPDAQACAAMVQAQQPAANGATYSNDGGTACYAEFGMTGSNDSNGWQSCMF